MWDLSTFNSLLKKDDAVSQSDTPESEAQSARKTAPNPRREIRGQSQDSEQRLDLKSNDLSGEEHGTSLAERILRTVPSHVHTRATSSVPSHRPHPSSSLDSLPLIDTGDGQVHKRLLDAVNIETAHAGVYPDHRSPYPSRLSLDSEGTTDSSDDLRIQQEIEQKWILNLSMHFRDNTDREKFFVTYMKEPNNWVRVTVSCDYRSYPPHSLEADLKRLQFQRDKSGRIYEAICDSLANIKFFATVTNLKIRTDDGKLHVHVTEDVNEIIKYPSASLLPYLKCRRYLESEVFFDSHESGFVYCVTIDGHQYIKKEIPGPEAVEEFLYEINALSSLNDSPHVISFEGLVMDEEEEHIKGLLLGFATNGALVDILYDHKELGSIPWPRRLKWATQIVGGLSDIHEAGFVQGDFTLSNIVIDSEDNALIIDINRRGCPVGWEPPEMNKMIDAGQKISIYIGVKTDVFQLSIVLWALAEENDEPEKELKPLHRREWPDVPQWYAEAFEACHATEPRNRPAVKDILKIFKKAQGMEEGDRDPQQLSTKDHDKPIDPSADVQTNNSGVVSRNFAGSSGDLPLQAISHPASWHLPAHQDSGFDEASAS